MTELVSILTPSECYELLGQATVGRIGVSIDALPVILPVHFALLEDAVIFRTRPGTKLDAAANGAVVAFQADEVGPREPRSWSVLVQGVAREVTDPDELARVKLLPMVVWPGNRDADRWVRIRSGKASGRRFG
jgi:nitroimidazol reductase NimA-like FMN-containing flavoprotein (pyridoxamine 5'-phosphate oxidase superfamily)